MAARFDRKRKRASISSASAGSSKRRRTSKKYTKPIAALTRRSSVKRTTKKKNFSRSIAGASSTSQSFPSRASWQRMYKKLAQPLHIAFNYGETMKVAIGKQAAALPIVWHSSSVILGQTMFNTINEALTASAPPLPVAAPNQNFSRRFMVNKVQVDYRMKNQTTTPIRVQIYDIVPRREIASSGDQNPIVDWDTGLTRQAVNLTNNTNTAVSSTIGTTPFQSKQFTSRWKVKNVSTFMLDAGMEHHHHINISVGGLFDAERTAWVWLTKGLSMISMIVISGGVSHSLITPDVTTTSHATLDIITTTRIVARMLEKQTVGTIQYNLLNQSLTQTRVVNEETDEVQPVVSLAHPTS